MIKSYLARQAIVDINQNIVAYELLFRDTKTHIQTMPTSTIATATCLLALFESGEIKNIIPDGIKAFINVDHNVLKARIVDKLNPEKFVIELLEHTELDQCEDIIRKLHSDGFTIAIDDFDCSPETYSRFKPILDIVDIVKICLHVIDVFEDSIGISCNECCEYLKYREMKLLAEKVETLEELSKCQSLGFDYYQGYYVSKPEVFEFISYTDVMADLKLNLS